MKARTALRLSVHPPPPHPGLTVGWLLEVDISIAQRAAGGHVAAHADGQDGAGWREFLVEHGLRYVWVQVAHIERGERKDWAAGVHGGRQRREKRAAGQHTPRTVPACVTATGARQRPARRGRGALPPRAGRPTLYRPRGPARQSLALRPLLAPHLGPPQCSEASGGRHL